jgi:hypothetical protein
MRHATRSTLTRPRSGRTRWRAACTTRGGGGPRERSWTIPLIICRLSERHQISTAADATGGVAAAARLPRSEAGLSAPSVRSQVYPSVATFRSYGVDFETDVEHKDGKARHTQREPSANDAPPAHHQLGTTHHTVLPSYPLAVRAGAAHMVQGPAPRDARGARRRGTSHDRTPMQERCCVGSMHGEGDAVTGARGPQGLPAGASVGAPASPAPACPAIAAEQEVRLAADWLTDALVSPRCRCTSSLWRGARRRSSCACTSGRTLIWGMWRL